MSTSLRGTQMLPILNECRIDAACLGNHDLDFGLEEFEQLRKECNFPWICSNAREKNTGRNLGGCEEFVVLDLGEGVKCLVLGLIEADWMSTLSTVDTNDVLYEDYNAYVTRRVPEITSEINGGVPFDLIVGATHMRMNNDYALAQGDGGKFHVDLILGGHDHHYEDTIKGERDIRILNSGTDFSGFTVVDIDLPESMDPQTTSPRPKLATRTEHVTIPQDGKEDLTVLESLEDAINEVNKTMDKPMGRTKEPLDARFGSIRTKETNISNFIADLLCIATNGQVAILNSGSLRADAILPAGELTVGDVCRILPMADETVVIQLTGSELIQALENGVSAYPSMEGRFPCVAGVRFEFDPSKEAGMRISPESVFVRRMPTAIEDQFGDEVPMRLSYNPSHGLVYVPLNDQNTATTDDTPAPIDPRASTTYVHRRKNFYDIPYDPIELGSSYTVVTKAYLADGKDGYDVFKDTPVIQDAENCPVLPTIVRNFFVGVKAMEQWSKVLPKSRGVLKAANKFFRMGSASFDEDGNQASLDPYAIRPVVDGRLRNVSSED
uniref:5'-Nucleotidase C-terminal domain-containing protein n=1 Tax=Ditylum brightwellii TaxID=49249 RepID=A0A6V2HWG9_9STRA